MKNKFTSSFTLIEIIVVIAVIGLLAAVAVPSFMKARIKSQNNTFVQQIRLAANHQSAAGFADREIPW